jgi:hypothetical protein
MTEPTPPGVIPPAFSANGHGPVTAAVQQVAAAIQQLPQTLFGAMSAALQQEQAAPLRCATCMLNRLQWGVQHGPAFAAAEAAFKAAAEEMAGRAAEDQVPLNPSAYVPEHLQPGGASAPAPINPGVVMIGGSLYCASHIPGAPGMPGQSPLLVAQANLPGLMAEMMRGRAA